MLPADVDVVSIYPHAHYLAKEMRGTATLPDGTERTLISIRRGTSAGRISIATQSPVFLPKGTTLRCGSPTTTPTATAHNPHRPAAAREMGTALDRRDGRAVARSAAATGRRRARCCCGTTPRGRCAPTSPARRCRSSVSPRDPLAHNFLATKYLQAGRVPDAVAQFERGAAAEAGRCRGAQQPRRRRCRRRGSSPTRSSTAQEAVRLKPDDDRVHFNLGNLPARRRGSPTRRCASCAARSQLNPENARRALQPGGDPAGTAQPARRSDRASAARGRDQPAERRRAPEPRVRPWPAGEAGRRHRGAENCAQDPVRVMLRRSGAWRACWRRRRDARSVRIQPDVTSA